MDATTAVLLVIWKGTALVVDTPAIFVVVVATPAYVVVVACAVDVGMTGAGSSKTSPGNEPLPALLTV